MADNKNPKEIVITVSERQELKEELAWREGENAARITASIQEARGFGDLSENAEYDAAKDEQARNEARINEIRQILAVAKVVDATDALSVSIGTTVELQDKRGKKTSFTIVGTTETDSLNHRISNESPAGSVLIGHVVGDAVSFTTPTGKVREYTITNITR
jgi:transcription elongation factor GreA